jgi:AAA+ ATPase superfamily predicted ATPase
MDNSVFIGREKEKKILHEALGSLEAEMVAIIGRRRIGKTFLIKETYKDQIVFEITGLQNGPLEEQLENFTFILGRYAKPRFPIQTPRNWLNAFMLLIEYLETLPSEGKKVIFLDELSWLATPKSGFLRALGFFWNSWAVNQNIVVVICGSAASWMIKKVVNHHGGLHNRITRLINLSPFTLKETEAYLQSRGIHFNRYQIVQIYMAMGGVPHYLKEIKADKSAVQNIDSICFSELGILRTEFQRLYPSLFEHADKHIEIIRALASSHQGLTRNKILEKTQFPDGGNVTRILEELTESGFISVRYPFGKKKKNMLYRLSDEYSLFYLQFIENRNREGNNAWQHLSQTQAYKTWSGYAYENICIKHLFQIKKTLSIAGIYSESSSFFKTGNEKEKGFQIDLLIDRNDQVINIFEIKFYNREFILSKDYAEKLKTKLDRFEEVSKTRKQLFLTLITTFGLKHNQHSLGLVNQVLTLDDLFLDNI